MAASTSRQQAEELGAGEQLQEALELASVTGGGVELEVKSASIKSISDSIQSSNACSLSSSCSFRSSSLSRISLSGSRRQLSVAPKWRAALGSSVKNEWKRESDEPDAPLLLHGDEASKEGDVVIGREQRNESNHKASDSLEHGWRIDRETTRLGPHWGRGHQFRSPNQQSLKMVRLYLLSQLVAAEQGQQALVLVLAEALTP